MHGRFRTEFHVIQRPRNRQEPTTWTTGGIPGRAYPNKCDCQAPESWRTSARKGTCVHCCVIRRDELNYLPRHADKRMWVGLFIARFGALCASDWVGEGTGGRQRYYLLTCGRLAGIVLQAAAESRSKSRLRGRARRLVRQTFELATCLAQGNRPAPARMRSRHLGWSPVLLSE